MILEWPYGHATPKPGSLHRTPRAKSGFRTQTSDRRRRYRLERLEAVSQAARDVEHPLVRRQFDAEVPRERCRLRPEVDDHVENRAARTARALPLPRGPLQYTAQRAGAPVMGHAGLDEPRLEAVGLELVAAPQACEKAPFISMQFCIDDESAGERGFGKDQGDSRLPEQGPRHPGPAGYESQPEPTALDSVAEVGPAV